MTPFTPLPVEPVFRPWHDYQLATYQAGLGPPVLLVHSINAAASAFEMRKPFLGLQDSFTVHAFDLLGFGRSDRPARPYHAYEYIDQIGMMLQHIGQPTAIIASTLGAAYAIGAATHWPALVRALVLVCPTGISLLSQPPGAAAAITYTLLRGNLGAAIFRALTSRVSMRYFVKQQTYGDPTQVDEETFNGFYLPAHQPGAMHAPISFVAGLLNYNTASAFACLSQPVLIVWGSEAKITTPDQAEGFVKHNPRARLEMFEGCGMIVQDERPDEFNALVREFL